MSNMAVWMDGFLARGIFSFGIRDHDVLCSVVKGIGGVFLMAKYW